MNIAVGNYRNKLDRAQKLEAYKKMLTARSNLNRRATSSFQDKLLRGDQPYISKLEELPKYKTTMEKTLDIDEQKKIAMENVMELLPIRSEALQFVQNLSTSDMADPLDPTNLVSEVAIFNIYFDKFKKKVEGIKSITSRSLLTKWNLYKDELVEDLLPKESRKQTMLKMLNDLKNSTPAFSDLFNTIERLEDGLKLSKLKEAEVNEIINRLGRIFDLDSAEREINYLENLISKSPLPSGAAAPVALLPPSGSPIIPSGSIVKNASIGELPYAKLTEDYYKVPSGESFEDTEDKYKKYQDSIFKKVIIESLLEVSFNIETLLKEKGEVGSTYGDAKKDDSLKYLVTYGTNDFILLPNRSDYKTLKLGRVPTKTQLINLFQSRWTKFAEFIAANYEYSDRWLEARGPVDPMFELSNLPNMVELKSGAPVAAPVAGTGLNTMPRRGLAQRSRHVYGSGIQTQISLTEKNPVYQYNLSKGRGLSNIEPAYYILGKFRILKSLDHGRLSVFYINGGKPSDERFKKVQDISPELVKLIRRLVDKQYFDISLYYKLDDFEKSMIHSLCEKAGILNVMEQAFDDGEIPINKTLQDKVDRYELVKGQLLAGNNNPEIIKEMTVLIEYLTEHGRMSKYQRNKIFTEIIKLFPS